MRPVRMRSQAAVICSSENSGRAGLVGFAGRNGGGDSGVFTASPASRALASASRVGLSLGTATAAGAAHRSPPCALVRCTLSRRLRLPRNTRLPTASCLHSSGVSNRSARWCRSGSALLLFRAVRPVIASGDAVSLGNRGTRLRRFRIAETAGSGGARQGSPLQRSVYFVVNILRCFI